MIVNTITIDPEFGNTILEMGCVCPCHPENKKGGSCYCKCDWKGAYSEWLRIKKYRNTSTEKIQNKNNKLVIEGMLDYNEINLKAVGHGELVRIVLELGRDRNIAADNLKTFISGKVVRVTIEEIDVQ